MENKLDHPIQGLMEETEEITDEEKKLIRRELESCARIVGGVTSFASLLGVSRSIFYHWMKVGVDGKRAMDIEKAVNQHAAINGIDERVSRINLCPWFFRGLPLETDGDSQGVCDPKGEE